MDAAEVGKTREARDHLSRWNAWLQDNQTRSGKQRSRVTDQMIHLELETYRVLLREDEAAAKLPLWRTFHLIPLPKTANP